MSIESAPLFQRILARTPFSERELVILIATAPTRYKDHYITKRNGRGIRLISQPTKEIKFLQRVLIKWELANLPIHEAATAYRKGHSTREHASVHASSRYLLKLDFRDFFPSIEALAIDYRMKQDTAFSQAERWLICNLLCRRPRNANALRLSIGAPSSPYISNYLMYEFDSKLTDFCNTKSVLYTRYADDLALSTSIPHVLDEVKKEVQKILHELSYLRISLNDEKTVNVSRKRRRTLVGLTLSNEGRVSVGREEKRILRASFHAFSEGRLSAEDIGRMRGQLAYVYGVDPDFVLNLCKRYGVARISDIGIT
jgi:retron-type reverse transcriptase